MKGQIWINEKEAGGEKGVDDDNNGYIDDVYGWNFLGNANGENIDATRLEKARILHDLKDKYENVDPKMMEQNEEFKLYVKVKKEELKNYNVLNSSQVDDIYSAILKDSDNLISESIAANISFRLTDTISVDKGVELIKSLSKQIELFDGSGLSRYNLVTPKSIISSLHDIYNIIGFERIKKIFPKNYIIQDREDFVWGKTGTLKNNHNYSGYIITDKNRIYIFSIMINHFTNDLSKIKDAIVDFLIYLKSNS